MRKELSDSAREGPAYEKMDNDSSNKMRVPIRYGLGSYLVSDRKGNYINSTLA